MAGGGAFAKIFASSLTKSRGVCYDYPWIDLNTVLGVTLTWGYFVVKKRTRGTTQVSTSGRTYEM